MCRRLREHPDTSALPVIFVSAANDTDAMMRGLEAGGVDYITKPFNKAELLVRVRNQVDLQRARETAAQVLRERENIISMVAHDLKNPLGAIRFSAQTLQELKPEQAETAAELIQHIVVTCDQVVGFVNRFLSRRAQEAERERMMPVPITTTQIQDMLEGWRRTARRKNITFSLHTPEQPVTVRGDVLTLGQILDNLMSNAVKFTPLGSHVATDMRVEDGSLVISIDDEGPGFSDSDHARMFQDYMRLSARPTGDESSTGLGLAIAKRGADRMGAGLLLQNRATGTGASARLSLPLWQDEALT